MGLTKKKTTVDAEATVELLKCLAAAGLYREHRNHNHSDDWDEGAARARARRTLLGELEGRFASFSDPAVERGLDTLMFALGRAI